MSEAKGVLIVGAGPTGLVAAIQLARYGVPLRIIDKEVRRSDKSRALAVHARTLEILDRVGLADELIRRGTRAQKGNIHVNGRLTAQMQFGDIGIDETPYPFILLVSQADTEQVLERYLNTLGVTVERPVTLTGFTQDDDGVVAKLQGSEGSELLRVRYLLGADGAHSTVRHGCNLAFEGEKYSNDFLLADVNVDWDRDYGQFHLFLGRKGVVACFPLPGPTAYRIICTRDQDESGGGDPTLREIEERMRRHCRVNVRLSNPRWLSLFRLHHRGVDRYRSRNAFVAGDAAHIHSPVGGQGMNTGIQDAWNLSWKLGLVMSGRAQPAILDSYHEERFPVGQRLLQFTDRLFSIVISRNWLLSLLRTWVIPAIAPFATRSRARRARTFRFISQIAIRYRSSRLNEEMGEFDTGPQAGDRVPDIAILKANGSATSLHAQLDGKRYCLLAFIGDDAHAARSMTTSLTGFENLVIPKLVTRSTNISSGHALIDEQGLAYRRFGIRESGLYLIRPDDHVAFRCQGLDTTALRDYLARFLLARNESVKNAVTQHCQPHLSSMS